MLGFFAEQLERKKYKLHVRVFLSPSIAAMPFCPECRGQRLRAEARAVLPCNDQEHL